MKNIFEQLSLETKCLEYEPLAKKTTLGVGGKARWYVEPATLEDLQILLGETYRQSISVFILGRGSNILVLDDGFDGVVVRLVHPFWRSIEVLDERRMYVGGGVRLKEITGKATELGWTGFEFMEGIPGGLGGSLRMNAGAMGGWMFDRVESVLYLEKDGTVQKVSKNSCEVTYRECKTLKDTVVIGAILVKEGQDDSAAIRERIEAYSKKRKLSQPREASAGCAFKNPLNQHAGKLIDQAGLKNLCVGGAAVSGVHGNFLVNKGNASSQDVLGLIERIREKIRMEHGIELEQEIIILGR